jgi:hypothetical protein
MGGTAISTITVHVMNAIRAFAMRCHTFRRRDHCVGRRLRWRKEEPQMTGRDFWKNIILDILDALPDEKADHLRQCFTPGSVFVLRTSFEKERGARLKWNTQMSIEPGPSTETDPSTGPVNRERHDPNLDKAAELIRRFNEKRAPKSRQPRTRRRKG